jgi:excisionase family DNA binding protein
MESELLTTSELCEWLKITRGTAWKWRKKGMPHVGQGKAIRYERSKVWEWLGKSGSNK